MKVPQRPGESDGPPGAEIIGSCERPDVGSGNRIQVSGKQQVLSPATPHFHFLSYYLHLFFFFVYIVKGLLILLIFFLRQDLTT